MQNRSTGQPPCTLQKTLQGAQRQAAARFRMYIFGIFAAAVSHAGSGFGAEIDHSHHQHQADARAGYSRAATTVKIPAISQRRADGTRVNFAAEIDDGRPVLLNFIYTTCTAICPPMTQVFAEFQRRLGAESDKVHMVSVSIDPEHDTPSRLDAYARQHGAGPQWTFYTGTAEASVALQKGFGAYRGDKMNHSPATWLRAAPGQPWQRLDGFVRPEELLQEYRQMLAAK